MADQPKKNRKRSKPRRTYVHKPNAVCVTIYSVDGSAVPRAVLDEAADSVTEVALRNNLLIGLAEV